MKYHKHQSYISYIGPDIKFIGNICQYWLDIKTSIKVMLVILGPDIEFIGNICKM